MHLCENSRKLKSSIRLLVCNCAIMTNKPSILSTLYGIYSYIKPNGCSLNLRTFPYRLIECVCVCETSAIKTKDDAEERQTV